MSYLFQRYRLQAENMAYHPQSINRILFTLPYRQLVIEGKYNNHLNLIERLFMMCRYMYIVYIFLYPWSL